MANLMHRVNSLTSDANFKLSCDMILPNIARPDQSSIDSILAHNNPEQAHIILPDGRKFVWYFAIGSMINPISLYLRDLTPLVSFPARCPNHRIAFGGVSGMATCVPCPEAEFDGVVHLLSNEDMNSLDKIESMYYRITVNVIDYQNQSHLVYAYQINISGQQESLPAERYLDVIIKGCEYYNVRPEYINRLKNEQPVVPRKQPHTFESFVDVPSDVFYSLDELARHNGSNPSCPLWISINGKIFEYAGLPSTDHPDYAMQYRSYHLLQSKLGGREVVDAIAKILYEPMYKLPLNGEDICDEYRARIEDNYVNMLRKAYWKAIGHVLRSGSSS